MTRPGIALLCACCLLLPLLAGCAATPAAPSPADPWERVNRGTERFNNAVDRAILKPVATGYRRHVPRTLRTGVSNFLANLAYPTTIVNDLLQFKLVAFAADVGRFALNSTLGLGGLLDPATDAGLPRHSEDFGQTLGKWGVPPGPYLVLPLLGPSTLRDAPATAAETQTDLRARIDFNTEWDLTLGGLSVVDRRASLLAAEPALERAYDRYALTRNAWLQRREYLVRDGDVPAEEPLELEDPAADPAEPAR